MRFSLKRGSDLARAAADLVLDTEPAAAADNTGTEREPGQPPEAPETPAEREDPAQPEAPAAPELEALAPAANAEAVASAHAEERQRVTDVFASDASNGKERVAASLLADSDMSAEKIVALLPKLGADASDSMLKTLASTPNPDLAPGAESRPSGRADAAGYWDRVHAKTFGTSKK